MSDIGGKVITLDALHTTRQTAKLITQRADDIFVVKGNAPETFAILDEHQLAKGRYRPLHGAARQGARSTGAAFDQRPRPARTV